VQKSQYLKGFFVLFCRAPRCACVIDPQRVRAAGAAKLKPNGEAAAAKLRRQAV
jgi:hypothetical protein